MKTKLTLSDYSYEQDIENRMLMSQFTTADVDVLEEILFSPLTFHLSTLASNIDRDLLEVMEVVDRLSQTGLCKRVGEVVTVDKEMRKYYESQSEKFDENFKPDMDYLQSLLRKVPIDALPIWYALPRSSSNIFESITEKYLRTPRIYQRYLLELGFEDPILHGIMETLFATSDYEIRSRALRDQFNLSRRDFQEKMLLLEFNFICCISYKKIDGEWKEIVTPFYEWRRHLRFLRDHKPIPLEEPVEELASEEFAFAKTFHQALENQKIEKLTDWIDQKLPIAKEHIDEWLQLTPEDLALALYRHPDNSLLTATLPEAYLTEKNFREVEKALGNIETEGWIDLDIFVEGMMAQLHTTPEIALTKQQRTWTYQLPAYSDEDKQFIKSAILERFFEAGFVSIGKHNHKKEAFRITPFGRSMLAHL